MMVIETHQKPFGFRTVFTLDGEVVSQLHTNFQPTIEEIEARREQILTPGCDDCAFLKHRCGECLEYDFEEDDYDDGQPSWEQEWQDFGEVYSDEY